MMKKVISVTLAFLISGCTTIFGSAYEKVADAVNTYCDKESYAQRVVYYEEVNSRLNNGNYIEVICLGDPESQGEIPE